MATMRMIGARRGDADARLREEPVKYRATTPAPVFSRGRVREEGGGPHPRANPRTKVDRPAGHGSVAAKGRMKRDGGRQEGLEREM